MATSIQSNPVYYSLASLSSGRNSSSRTVVLHKRPDHDGFGVYIGEDVPSGLYIVTVERNSPASDAKIQPGDRVLAVNGQLVSSMAENPKDMLIKAASNAEHLTLTIQSTDIFQTLNIPLTNSYKDNDNNNQNKQRYSSKQGIYINTNLEGYIKSLFANENVQILPSTNNNEFILSSDSHKSSSLDFNLFPPSRHSRSSGYKQEHHHHHHQHNQEYPRRRQKRALLITKETQTSINDDQDETMLHEKPQTSTLRQHPSYPIMGTSQRILNTQPPATNNNATNELQESKFLSTNKGSKFTGIPPSPTMDNESSDSATNQTPLPAFTAEVSAAAGSSTTNKETRNSRKNTQNSTQHMADVVAAAMTASRNRGQSNNREQISSREPPSVTKQTTTPPSSRQPLENNSRESAPVTKRATTPPPSQQPLENNSRQPAPVTNRTTTPPSSRQPLEKTSRESASVTKRITTPPPQRQRSPPPYSTSTDAYTSSTPVNNRGSTDEGQYNVRNAQVSREPATSGSEVNNIPSSIRGEGAHQVHLHRIPNFQGFGFHLQYNKIYYLVHRVEHGSPAEVAGLHTNDVILAINHQLTDTMPHALFVQIVNASTDVSFIVQHIDEYLRMNPPPVRNQQAASAVSAAINNDNDGHKSGLSKALTKLTSR